MEGGRGACRERKREGIRYEQRAEQSRGELVLSQGRLDFDRYERDQAVDESEREKGKGSTGIRTSVGEVSTCSMQDATPVSSAPATRVQRSSNIPIPLGV